MDTLGNLFARLLGLIAWVVIGIVTLGASLVLLVICLLPLLLPAAAVAFIVMATYWMWASL